VSLLSETLFLCLCPAGCKIKVRTSADTSATPPKSTMEKAEKPVPEINKVERIRLIAV